MSKLSNDAIAEIALLQRHYHTSIDCWNCGHHNGAHILKGRPKLGYVIECDKCGCKIDMGKAKP